MIELAKHIEVLLLENDCVIVPGLGGFIAHYRPSFYCKDRDLFCPPARTVGFNPRLVMNDGLLVQSYMQAQNTDFPDATRRIEQTVEKLEDCLYRQGSVALGNIGTLYYNMGGTYEFEPAGNGFFTPSLYGMQAFSLPRLPKREETQLPTIAERPVTSRQLPVGGWLKSLVTTAAAIVLFFILSVPVGNTYIDDADYAALGSAGLFETVSSFSATSGRMTGNASSAGKQEKKDGTRKSRTALKNNVNTLKPVTVKTEKVTADAPAKAQATKKKDVPAPAPTSKTKKSYVIVASLTTDADAQRTVKELQKKGYAEACVVESKGRYRVAIAHYAAEAEALRKTKEIKKEPGFENAWVFTTR